MNPKSALIRDHGHQVSVSSKGLAVRVVALGGPGEEWMAALPGRSELPGDPVPKLFEKGTTPLLPCGVLALFCAVSRLVCKACVKAERNPKPAECLALCGVCQAHPVGVPRRASPHVAHANARPCVGSARPILWVCPGGPLHMLLM